MGILAEGRPKCKHCGFRDERVLQIDHIHEDGFNDRKQFKSRYEYFKFYLNNHHIALYKLQLLCCNCHFIKTWRLDL